MIAAGKRFGPYEVIASLGAGGMGEVWLARDTRLSREVAIKVLPAEVADDASRLKRFEKEARAASALNHPNIVTIYEIGTSAAISYIAMERVQGKTLRELLFAGPLPVKRLLSIATQIADGLARAHEAGIVHRDLKPENIMVTKDGLVKILDFGLAKRTSPEPGSGEGSHLPTQTGTSPGMILGTVGYMSPEQAAGSAVDFRSDQFAVGSILYEMATGKRAFQKKTGVETLTAILNEEPEPVGVVNPHAPAPLRWIVERCLAKEPGRRYASTLDLARDLETLRDRSSQSVAGAPESPRPRSRSVLAFSTVASALLVAATLLAGRALWKRPSTTLPNFQRLTFRRGFVDAARFSSDGRTIFYSAQWDGEPSHVFLTRPENPTSQRLELPDATLLAVSARGELAIKTRGIGMWVFTGSGTLTVAPVGGGGPREVATGIGFADWSPDGRQMAANRNGHLEFPMSKTIYTPKELVWHPRISPRGDRIAFLEERRVHVVDLSGKERFVSMPIERGPDWRMTLAWGPSGDEIWISAGETITALGLDGKQRDLFRGPREVILRDVSRDGRSLVCAGPRRDEVWSKRMGDSRERDLSVLGNSDAMGMTPDGKSVLVNENLHLSDAGFYLTHADGSPPKKLGDGYASELSADGKWAVVVRPGPPSHLVLVPTDAGEEKALENGGIEWHERERIGWSLDGRRLLFYGREKGHGDRCYVQEVAGGKPRPLTPEGVDAESCSISPDGRFVIAQQSDGPWMYPVEGGEKRLLAGVLPTDFVSRNWSGDGRFVYVWDAKKLPFDVFRVDLTTGKREPWKTILPQDPAGIWSADLMLTPDGQSYAYNCRRSIQDLYLVEGLK